MTVQQLDHEYEFEWLSAGAHDRLRRELTDLRATREVLARSVNDGADPVGDLADQAEILGRFDELDRLDVRIEEVMLALDRPVRATPPASDRVEVGTTVTLVYADGTREVVVIGDRFEEHGEASLVTPGSPLGRAMLGHGVGEEVTYIAPSGEVTIAIQAIGAPLSK